MKVLADYVHSKGFKFGFQQAPGGLFTASSAGGWVDYYATAIYWNLRFFNQHGALDTLFGWLTTHVNRWSGMWGSPTADGGRQQMVNGYYRLVRGSFAQFGLPMAHPESAIDTVVAHSRDTRYFREDRGNAYNVLDVIHPLWLCVQQTRHHADDFRRWTGWHLDRALSRWQPGAGFAFALEPEVGSSGVASLKGTEMWLSIIWLLADTLGHGQALGYRPRGVHRPEPAWPLPEGASCHDSKPTNVVVFLTDQQRWDTTGMHGNPLDLTPNLDRMAQSGTHIVNSFTCQPVCGPSRASLQTGQYPTTVGCFHNHIPLAPTTRTLAHYFGDAGYATGYIGKWHLADRSSLGPVAPGQRGGYDYWLAANVLEHTSDAYDTVVYDNDSNPVKLPGYRADALTDAAIRFVDSHQDKPFFLFISYVEPHHQNHRDDYPAPIGYDERYRGRWTPPDLAALGGSAHRHLSGYYGMVKRLDEALGRLLDMLTSLSLRDDTFVLFTSDHGNHFKTRNKEYKRSVHDVSIRVPTVLTGPGLDRGAPVRQLVGHVDLAPTLLDAAGLKVPKVMQGRSIMPLVSSDASDWPGEVFVQVSESQVARAVRTTRWKYGVVAPDADAWEQSGADNYVETYLYNVQSDPYELENLVQLQSHAPVAERLRERLLHRMVDAGEPAPQIIPAATRQDRRRVSPSEIEL